MLSLIPRLFSFLFGNKMTAKPPLPELEFLKLSGNHNDFERRLAQLQCSFPELKSYVTYVSKAWFNLGTQHLAEAKKIASLGCDRAVYSRAYYAAYNVSKGARYMMQGSVSLKGDDHGKASTELPGDFPDQDKWARKIGVLYEHRLKADYDNWDSTVGSFSLTAADAIKDAEDFIMETQVYLQSRWTK